MNKFLLAVALLVAGCGDNVSVSQRTCPCDPGVTGYGAVYTHSNGNVDYGPCVCPTPAARKRTK